MTFQYLYMNSFSFSPTEKAKQCGGVKDDKDHNEDLNLGSVLH